MPRVMLLLPLAALAGCHGASGDHDAAKALIASHCAGCHTVPGVATAKGMVGPPLAGVAVREVIAGKLRNSPATLQQFLLHPQSVQPGGAMPEMGLTPAQAKSISDYLFTLDKP